MQSACRINKWQGYTNSIICVSLQVEKQGQQGVLVSVPEQCSVYCPVGLQFTRQFALTHQHAAFNALREMHTLFSQGHEQFQNLPKCCIHTYTSMVSQDLHILLQTRWYIGLGTECQWFCWCRVGNIVMSMLLIAGIVAIGIKSSRSSMTASSSTSDSCLADGDLCDYGYTACCRPLLCTVAGDSHHYCSN